jgi:hypothetical protein
MCDSGCLAELQAGLKLILAQHHLAMCPFLKHWHTSQIFDDESYASGEALVIEDGD